ncbi:MAG: biotin transporter BioY [Euzebyales bacterium]|jgi:biotin transport system substrate-specific component|nr:biotin transporter BioY [Euzebyales bacterium]
MSASSLVGPRPVLADRLPLPLSHVAARDVLLVAGGALLTAAAAQVAVPLPFTPVPLSGQTFAVLLVAAALGPLRGSLAQVLYIALAMVGLPFYAEASGGVEVVFGATGGYVFGFVVASVVVGHLARRGVDRKPVGVIGAYVAGSLIIYSVGVPWLAAAIDVPLLEAVKLGLVPFLIGDAIKAVLAAGLLPAAWKLLGER